MATDRAARRRRIRADRASRRVRPQDSARGRCPPPRAAPRRRGCARRARSRRATLRSIVGQNRRRRRHEIDRQQPRARNVAELRVLARRAHVDHNRGASFEQLLRLGVIDRAVWSHGLLLAAEPPLRQVEHADRATDNSSPRPRSWTRYRSQICKRRDNQDRPDDARHGQARRADARAASESMWSEDRATPRPARAARRPTTRVMRRLETRRPNRSTRRPSRRPVRTPGPPVRRRRAPIRDRDRT